MQPRPFTQVDVFSPVPYQGNPVAVVSNADGLTTDQMQTFAHWTNLSETTFLLPPTDPRADYRARIFTPRAELPFAGHPTLGSAHAWLERGGQPASPGTVVQECGAGLIEIRRDAGVLSFAAPPTIRSGALEPDYLARAIDALGVEPSDVVAHQWVDNGPGWAAIALTTAERVLAIEPDFSRLPSAMLGVIGAYPPGHRTAFEIRAFAPGVGVGEDPVTGSLNASVAQWLARTASAPACYLVSQGRRVGRAGEVAVTREGETIWIGGATVTCIEGTVRI